MSKLPQSFNTEILSRFIKGKDMEEFYEQYKANCLKVHNKKVSEPNQKDLRIVAVLRKTQSYRITAKELGLSPYQVMSAASRVGTYSA